MSKLCTPFDVEDVCRKEDQKKNPASMNRKPIHKPLQYFTPYSFPSIGSWAGPGPRSGAWKGLGSWPDICALFRRRKRAHVFLYRATRYFQSRPRAGCRKQFERRTNQRDKNQTRSGSGRREKEKPLGGAPTTGTTRFHLIRGSLR